MPAIPDKLQNYLLSVPQDASGLSQSISVYVSFIQSVYLLLVKVLG